MTIELRLRKMMMLAGLTLAVACGSAVAQEVPLVTGEH